MGNNFTKSTANRFKHVGFQGPSTIWSDAKMLHGFKNFRRTLSTTEIEEFIDLDNCNAICAQANKGVCYEKLLFVTICFRYTGKITRLYLKYNVCYKFHITPEVYKTY